MAVTIRYYMYHMIYLLGKKKIDFEEFTTSLNEKLQDDHRMDEID